MDISGLLNADLRTVGRMIKRGVGWWSDELRAMAPERWRMSASGKTRAVILITDQGYQTEGGGGERLYTPGAGNPSLLTGAVLCLPRTAGLVATLDLPLMSSSDLRRLVALDIDRLTPFQEKDVYFDFIVEQRDEQKQRVAVGIVPKRKAETELSRLSELGT